MMCVEQSEYLSECPTELLYIFLFQDYQLPTSCLCHANVFILLKNLAIFNSIQYKQKTLNISEEFPYTFTVNKPFNVMRKTQIFETSIYIVVVKWIMVKILSIPQCKNDA